MATRFTNIDTIIQKEKRILHDIFKTVDDDVYKVVTRKISYPIPGSYELIGTQYMSKVKYTEWRTNL